MNRMLWLAAGIVALVSALVYLRGDAREPLPWPETDIVPVTLRMADEGYLADDFFTNASARPNPRWIHAWLVHALAAATGASPIVVLHALRAALALALPALFIVALVRIRELEAGVGRLCPDAPEAAFRAFVAILTPAACFGATSCARIFGVALWSPVLGGQAAPSNIALLVGSLGVLLHERHGRWPRAAGLACLFAAGLVHPFTGPALTVVYLLFKLAAGIADRRRLVGALAAGIVVPMATVAIAFAPETSPSVGVVTEIYAHLRHPHHYVPSMFGSFSLPWTVSFSLVCAILLVNLTLGVLLRDRYHARAAALALGSYGGAVLAQYVLVEMIPLKAVVLLGPSRFTLFGYWLAAILTARLAVLAWARRRPDRMAATLRAWTRASAAPSWGYRAALLLLLVVALAIGAGAFLRSTAALEARRKVLEDGWSWAPRLAGRQGPVVALPPELATPGLRELAGVAPLVDGYYPFDLDALEPYGERYRAVYGFHLDLPAGRRTAEEREFYDGLSLREIVEIGRRWPFDYWVMHAGAAAAADLAATQPVIRGQALVVYNYTDMAEALARNDGDSVGPPPTTALASSARSSRTAR